MSRTISAAVIATAFAARHPGVSSGGVVPSIDASAGTVESVQAMAVRGFASPSGKLVWVKAREHFFASSYLTQIGDFVEIKDSDARDLVRRGFAEIVDPSEVAAADLAGKTKVKA